MGLDTKTYWLTDRQSQCDFDSDFDFAWSLMGLDTKTYWLTDRQSQCDFDFDFDFGSGAFSAVRAEVL
jgi:hypothetical protein